jgi:hypothetical protein
MAAFMKRHSHSSVGPFVDRATSLAAEPVRSKSEAVTVTEDCTGRSLARDVAPSPIFAPGGFLTGVVGFGMFFVSGPLPDCR